MSSSANAHTPQLLPIPRADGTPWDWQELSQCLVAIARSAGEEILSIYGTDSQSADFSVRHKDDASPVTEADERGEAIILEGLEKACPGTAIVAEERVSRGGLPEQVGDAFFLVDPLDGTREFIKRNGEFTVNIALVCNKQPVLGVVYLPALQTMYYNDIERCWRIQDDQQPEAIECRKADPEGLVVVTSRSHRDGRTDDYLKDVNVASLSYAGSSLKLCRVAEAPPISTPG